MINCSPPVKSVCHSSATPKLSAKARKSKSNQLMARSATAKLEQLTPVSSPEANSARQSSPLCAKMPFDEDSRSAEGEMCNQAVKCEKPQFSEATDQTTVNQAAPPQSPLSNSSSPSPARQEPKAKGSCSPASRQNAGSPNDGQLAKSVNNGNSCSYNNSTGQLAAQLNSPNSPTASISSTCSSSTNANATPHGINDILKKSSADAAANAANSGSNSNSSSASNLIDNHLSVFAAVASAAAINNNGSLASTFTNSSPKLTGTGSQLAHATSALAAAVANRFYFNNNATSGGNNSAPQAPTKANQSNTNSNPSAGSTAPAANNANSTSPPRNNAALNNNAALKLNLNDLSSRQFYWQQMVQNQALWQERFSQAVNTVANGASPNGAYSNLNSPLANSSLLNHCNGQAATPAQANLDSSFNCK